MQEKNSFLYSLFYLKRSCKERNREFRGLSFRYIRKDNKIYDNLLFWFFFLLSHFL